MSLLAVSVPLSLALLFGQIAVQPPSGWSKVSRSLVQITTPDHQTSYGVLIDRKGLFMAHSSLISSNQVAGTLSSGKVIILDVLAFDEPTQLALLAARLWVDRDLIPVVVANSREVLGRPVFAALSSGPVRGELVAIDRPGLMKPSLRYVPLSEIRFETQQTRIGGALVFTDQGSLVGVLSATLEPVIGAENLSGGLSAVSSPLTKGRAGGGVGGAGGALRQFGPTGMTVSYAVGIDVLQRVVKGFNSPDHQPEHPTIGVFYRDSAEKGAVIEAVLSGSTADKAGLKQGDVIVQLNDRAIANAFDLAAALFKQNVGTTIKLLVRKPGSQELLAVQVVVGKLEERSANDRKLFDVPLKGPGSVKRINNGSVHRIKQ